MLPSNFPFQLVAGTVSCARRRMESLQSFRSIAGLGGRLAGLVFDSLMRPGGGCYVIRLIGRLKGSVKAVRAVSGWVGGAH